jgi:hypothetical protein
MKIGPKALCALLLLGAGAPLAGCGGKSGTISLQVVVSPADDPFAGATTARITVGNGLSVKTVAVMNGHFNFDFSQMPMSMGAASILIEALDASGNAIAYGQTPVLSLQAADQGPYSVWVGRPDKIAPAAASLMIPRTEMAAIPIAGLGVLYAGGRGSDGKAISSTEVYDVYTQGMIETSPMTQARAGAVGVAVAGVRATVFGGATADGFDAPGAPLNTLELFDPTVGVGLWAPVMGGATDARSQPGFAILPSGSALVAGGLDGNGMPLATAALLTTDSSPTLTPVPSPMAAARSQMAIAPAKFPDGEGAILFGGLPINSTAPVAERLVGQAFSAYDLGAQPNRTGATATQLHDGRVLVLGGHDDSGAVLATGFVITPGTPAQVTALPTALSTPRDGHSATLLANSTFDLLVCGGLGQDGKPIASCDVLDGSSLAIKSTIPLGLARTQLSATLLETGNVLLAGGLDPSGAPSGVIEIYTPTR